MLERDFLKLVTDMADRFGWKWWHVPAPMVAAGKDWRPYKKAAGLPDLVLIHDDPPRLIFAEIKGDKGKLSDAQREFLQAARAVAETSWSPAYLNTVDPDGLRVNERTIDVYVWTPKDADTVEQILRTRVLI